MGPPPQYNEPHPNRGRGSGARGRSNRAGYRVRGDLGRHNQWNVRNNVQNLAGNDARQRRQNNPVGNDRPSVESNLPNAKNLTQGQCRKVSGALAKYANKIEEDVSTAKKEIERRTVGTNMQASVEISFSGAELVPPTHSQAPVTTGRSTSTAADTPDISAKYSTGILFDRLNSEEQTGAVELLSGELLGIILLRSVDPVSALMHLLDHHMAARNRLVALIQAGGGDITTGQDEHEAWKDAILKAREFSRSNGVPI
ncbi:MAG: hypothetical protein MMC33_009613 [Icmadophila ericetorum]|nr:hypothetical protein [Icmadophila ericetorum]